MAKAAAYLHAKFHLDPSYSPGVAVSVHRYLVHPVGIRTVMVLPLLDCFENNPPSGMS